MEFSVLMSVYKNDDSTFFRKALSSVIEQTIMPNEIVLVIDGPIKDDLEKEILMFSQKYEIIKLVRLNENMGLGKALQIGLESCSFNLVARMDSDDISVENRFEELLKCFERDDNLTLVGSYISEFIGEETDIVGIREVPLNDYDIKDQIKVRCPINHVSVMFKKDEILGIGGYIHWHYNEDYFLWIRMLEAGHKFENINKCLVNVRVGEEMYKRRGGIAYYQSEINLQKYMLKQGVISKSTYLGNVFIRFVVQIVFPNHLRGYLYKLLFRKKNRGTVL